jgi:cytochrome o ubiquinol oxidase subunit 1
VHDIDAFTDMKEKGVAYVAPAKYAPIHMPKNTSAGVFIGAFCTVLGFAMIWHIWWLAIVGFVGVVASMLARAYDNDIDYYVQPEEIAKIEGERLAKLGINVRNDDQANAAGRPSKAKTLEQV